MILHIENPQELHKLEQNKTTTKLLELIEEFSKVVGYNINIQMSFAICTLTVI